MKRAWESVAQRGNPEGICHRLNAKKTCQAQVGAHRLLPRTTGQASVTVWRLAGEKRVSAHAHSSNESAAGHHQDEAGHLFDGTRDARERVFGA